MRDDTGSGEGEGSGGINTPSAHHAGVGHRERLRERFECQGLGALHPHEVIELVLTYTIPRKDTKKIARALIERFGGLSALVNASTQEIIQVSGVGKRSALHFRLIGELLAYCLKERYNRRPIIAHQNDVVEYLRFTYGYRRDEFMAALYLGNRHQVIETVVVAEGTVNQCIVHPRSIVEKALRFGAAAIIVAHNHPGGSHTPSDADWEFSERLFTICRLLDMPLLDHLIVSAERVVSLRQLPRWPGVCQKTRS